MDHQDRQAIEQLFGKISQVEGQAGTPDAQAAEFIRSQITRPPNAPYYMAQTILVQEQALTAAQARIHNLEQELASRPAGGGGFLPGLFGSGQSRPQPGQPEPACPACGRPWHRVWGHPACGHRLPGGGGFMAGAAQTAMGVAGGVVLGNMIANAFSGGVDEAKTADAGTGRTAAGRSRGLGCMPEAQDFGFEEDILNR